MSDTAFGVTCPTCGAPFVPPRGAARFFCPQCGMRIERPPVAMTPEQAKDQAARAIEQAAQAAEQAAQAARLAEQATSRAEAVELAQQATRQAAEALQAAQAAHKAQQQHVAQQGERLAQQQMAQAQATQADSPAAGPPTPAASPSRGNASAVPAQATTAQVDAAHGHATANPAPAQATTTQTAPAQATTTQTAPAQPKAPEYRRNVTVRHTDGRGMYVVTIPTDWLVQSTDIRRQSTRPYNPCVSFINGKGASMRLWQGDAGAQLSEGMKALMNTYGAAIAGVDHTNYAPMPHPVVLADDYMRRLVNKVGATKLRYVRDVPSTDLAARQVDAQRAFEQAARAQGNVHIKDPFAAEVLRVYEFELNGITTNAAVYVRLYAIKEALGVENLSPMGLMFNAGSALGGFFSKGKRNHAAQQKRPEQGGNLAWSQLDFDGYTRSGTIYWDVCGMATLTAPGYAFEELLNTTFVPLVRTYDVHHDITSLVQSNARQEAAMVQQATNRQINAMNMQHQATMAAARSAQAAADARFESWQRQSDARHAAFRERTNAQFNSSIGGGVGDFSEAIRGVNTFMTSDGREVELSIQSDRAYENQAGDVIGGSGGFDPGADWTEIPRV